MLEFTGWLRAGVIFAVIGIIGLGLISNKCGSTEYRECIGKLIVGGVPPMQR